MDPVLLNESLRMPVEVAIAETRWPYEELWRLKHDLWPAAILCDDLIGILAV